MTQLPLQFSRLDATPGPPPLVGNGVTGSGASFSGGAGGSRVVGRRKESQCDKVERVLRDVAPRWISARAIRKQAGLPPDTAVTARVRDLRKPANGAHVIECEQRAVAAGFGRLWMYRWVR